MFVKLVTAIVALVLFFGYLIPVAFKLKEQSLAAVMGVGEVMMLVDLAAVAAAARSDIEFRSSARNPATGHGGQRPKRNSLHRRNAEIRREIREMLGRIALPLRKLCALCAPCGE